VWYADEIVISLSSAKKGMQGSSFDTVLSIKYGGSIKMVLMFDRWMKRGEPDLDVPLGFPLGLYYAYRTT